MAHLTNFSFEFFYKIFTEDVSQPLLYHGAKKSKMTKNSNQGGPALIFFLFESSWKKMKNDTTFERMRSGHHLGDTKMSKKGTSLRQMKEEGLIYKTVPQFFKFLPSDLVMIFQSLVIFLPRFFDFERP